MSDDAVSRWVRPAALVVVCTSLLLSAVAQILPAGSISPSDYLKPPLTAEVAALKQAARSVDSNIDNAGARARTLYDWANAFALSGREISPDLPLVTVGIIEADARGWPDQNAASRDRLLSQMDMMIDEMTFRDANPKALGQLVPELDDPIVVDSHGVWSQTYVVGEAPVRPGGGFIFTLRVMGVNSRVQTSDPAADNYLSIRSSRSDVAFEAITHPFTGLFAGTFGSGQNTPQPFFRLTRGVLQPGDRVTLTLGDRSGGSRGYRAPSYTTDGVRLRVWVKLGDDDRLFPLKELQFRTIGAAAAGVRGLAPSVVRPGQPFDLTIRTEDRYLNQATGPAPAYRLFLDGAPWRTTPAGAPALQTLTGLVLDRPGPHHITIRSDDGAIAGRTNPVLVDADRELIAWGETHGHTGFAEGTGTVDEYYRFARDDARLDFVVLSEHDTMMDDAEWRELVDGARKHDAPGFVTYLGYEWTAAPIVGGHHNVFFRTNDGRQRVGRHRAPQLPQLYEGLRKENRPEDVMIIPHAHAPGDWMQNDPDMERLVEVVSQHGTFEWFGRRYLEQGHRVGFIGASDDHQGHPGIRPVRSDNPALDSRGGIAAVVTPEMTRDGIFDAMRSWSTYATNGERMILDVSANGVGMGQIAPKAGPVRLSGRVIGSSPIETITVLKNGAEVQTTSFVGRQGGSGGRRRTLEISFFSDTDPHALTSSRGWRVWRGTAEIDGANLGAASALRPENPHRIEASLAAGAANRAELAIRTRGSWNSALLDVSDVSPGATLKLQLAATADAPEIVETIRLRDIARGVWEKKISVGQNTDIVRIGFYTPPERLERSIQYSDPEAKAGDHYFVRVQQTNGGLAWSSPIWVERP